MKLVTFVRLDDVTATARPGVVVEAAAAVLDLGLGLAVVEREAGQDGSAAAVAGRYGGDLLAMIERQAVSMPAVRGLLARVLAGELPGDLRGQRLLSPLAEVRLLAPLPRPLSLRDGYAFRQHVEAARRNRGLPMIAEYDELPIFYYSNHLSVIGPGAVAVRAAHLVQLDFELEAAVVVGKQLRDADVATADEAIFGLMVCNDLSARGLQMQEMKLNLGPAKGKDFATALGPYLVPKEDLRQHTRPTARGNQFDLGMVARHNGEEVARGSLGDMTWTFAEILARASYGVTLHPGEVIGSGTVGTGCFLETNGSKVYDNRWLQDGDRIDCEIEGLGCLQNYIQQSPEPGGSER